MILTFVEGPLEDNNYLIYNEETKNAVLIDCTTQSNEIDNAIKKNNLNLKYILLTHGHFDHVLGVNYYRKKYGAKSVLHKDDINIIKTINEFMQHLGMRANYEIPIIDEFYNNSIVIDDELKFDVIHTPGHTNGSVCLQYNDKLFSGDTLFLECYGRTDTPSGSFEKIEKSLKNLFELNENIKVFPGHGSNTSIEHEKKYNMIIRG